MNVNARFLFLAKAVLGKISFPVWQDALLSLASAVLLILAFPDFELWWLAWFALVPLFVAIVRNADSISRSFILGWLSGTVFFYATCWWLTYAPINYGGLPAVLMFALLIPATLGAGFFVGVFAAALARMVARFGVTGLFAAPFLWATTEWLRLIVTGNNWNALGYSQAFVSHVIQPASLGGVYSVSFLLALTSAASAYCWTKKPIIDFKLLFCGFLLVFSVLANFWSQSLQQQLANKYYASTVVVALQPNVPMSALMLEDYNELRERHVEMAEAALREIDNTPELQGLPRVVVFPESPMNFAYARDAEYREFFSDFTRRNRVSLIFNAGEPATLGDGYHNSAVMLNEGGEKIAQYDKIRLVPFGEFVPGWIPGNEYLPTVVGRTMPGENFRLMPFGSSVRAGVMICYESAFGDISREFVRNGADVLVELTNDGYSGDTPILRQHLANAVFRAVETNRPVLRVTNAGITAYINERGEISGATESFVTATRTWTIAKSDGRETFYVRYGDVFVWFCAGLSLILLTLSFGNKK